MTSQSWLIYLALVLVACSTPGPAVLFIMTNATMHGWRKAFFSALGNITGLWIMGIIAITGLGALLNASELFFKLVKFIGAAYLIYLGIKLFFHRGIEPAAARERFSPAEKAPGTIYLQAIGVAMSNPKAIVFLTALFPQFIVTEQPLTLQFILLIGTLMFFSFIFLMGYALLAHKAQFWLMNPRRLKIFSRCSGSIFIGFGALLASSHR